MFSNKSPFEMFNIKPNFIINNDELEKKYIAMQAQFHPDKFIGQSHESLLKATEQSGLINKAYKDLMDPLSRAGILIPKPYGSNANNNDLLMEALELREAIESSKDLEHMKNFVGNKIKAIEDLFDEAWKQSDHNKLNNLYLQMQYLYKAKIEIKNKMLK